MDRINICSGCLPLLLFLAACGGSQPAIPVSPAPTVTLSMSLNPAPAGLGSTLTWSSQNASSCNANGAWTGPQPTSGTQAVTQSAAGTYNYRLSCSGAGGTGSASVAFVVSASEITADVSRPGPAMNRDQLGANLNIGYPDNSDSAYIPQWTSAGVALFRWPGGLLSDYYHWQTHSYGPCAPWPNPPAENLFDTWMKAVAQPMHADVAITVNYGTDITCTGPGDPNEAAAWVDYANNVEHYGVKYWTVGNEEYLDGEPDLHSPEHDPLTYANLVTSQFYPLMKAKDPTIQVGIDVAFGNATYSQSADTWDPIVLANATYDFVEMHYYPEHNNLDDDSTLLTQWSDQVATNFATVQSLLSANGHANTPIFFGEFDRDSGGTSGPGHETVSVVDALFTAVMIAEAAKAGVSMTAAWQGIDDCWPEFPPISTAYGSQTLWKLGTVCGQWKRIPVKLRG